MTLANETIRDAGRHTPLWPSIVVAMLTLPFNMQGIYNNKTTQLIYPHYLLNKQRVMHASTAT
jgi:hypothetical protein